MGVVGVLGVTRKHCKLKRRGGDRIAIEPMDEPSKQIAKLAAVPAGWGRV